MQVNKYPASIVVSVLLVILISFDGCFHKKMVPEEYMKWVKKEENGLLKEKTIGQYHFRCQYKPADFVVISEKGKRVLTGQEVAAKKAELDGMQYYDLYLGYENGDLIKSFSGSEKEFYDRMYYYSFGFGDDIKLIEGTDTLACELYHFERDYDLAKEKRFLLGFEKKKESYEDKTLCIDSKVLGLAIVKIQIKNKDIQNIPEVEYETKN